MFKKSEHKVYKMKTIDKVVIYIGRTGRLVQERYLEHSKDKFWIGEVAEVEECYIGSEADASITENIYINKYKPIFNKKDKFSGYTKTKPQPAFKKFSHSFYVFNKRMTTCVPTFNEGYTLVDVISIDGNDIGVYYNDTLDLFFSASDLMTALDVDKKKLKAINKKELTKVSYEITNLGRKKTLNSFLCNITTANNIINLCENKILGQIAYNKLFYVYSNADMTYMYGSEISAETVKESFLEEMVMLPEGRYNDSHTKRRLAYEANSKNREIRDVILEFNQSINEYLEMVQLELMSCEIFNMIQDIVVEHSTEYRYVSEAFSNKLKNNNVNLFKIKCSIAKEYNMNPKDVTLHFAISARKNQLYNCFVDFYNECIA